MKRVIRSWIIMKNINRFLLLLFSIFFTLSIGNPFVYASENDHNEKVINEKYGPTIVVFGERLSESQREETKRLLKVDEEADVKEIIVTGADAAKYINGDPNSNMYSSAKIKRLDKGEGITVVQATPENITEVTDEMYANALITAGVEDAEITVASPVKVTGHSALTGIFKAYEATGEELDTARLDVANQELDLSTKLAEEAGVDENQVSQLMTEIKKAIAEQDPATKEEVKQIVEEQLKKLNIEIPDEYKQKLIHLFDQIRNLNINFDELKSQLNQLTNVIKDKLGEVDPNVLAKIWNSLKDIFIAIVNFFNNLLS